MSLRTATDMTLRQNVEDASYQFDRLNNDASQAAWARRYGRPMIEARLNGKKPIRFYDPEQPDATFVVAQQWG